VVQIFAGKDRHGVVRYVGEVPGGIECGCECLVCASPLVAKKGAVNEWHFAHASGQQRPECMAGARNLIRSVALEHLAAVGRLPLREDFVATARAGGHALDASWNAAIRDITWLAEPGGTSSPAASLALESGPADLYLSIEGDNVGVTGDPQRGALLLTLPLPDTATFRSREALVQHVEQHLRAQWLYLPDYFGLLEQARDKVMRLAEEERFRLQAWQQQRAEEAGRRWARIREGLEKAPQEARNQTQAPAATPWGVAPSTADVPEKTAQAPAASLPAWAAGWKPGTGLFCMSLKDGSYWLLYETAEHGYLLRPWNGEEGWDEALPPSVGIADEPLGAYRVKDFLTVKLALRDLEVGLRNTSDPGEVEGLFQALSK